MRLHIGTAFNSLKLTDYLEEEELGMVSANTTSISSRSSLVLSTIPPSTNDIFAASGVPSLSWLWGNSLVVGAPPQTCCLFSRTCSAE